MKITWNNYWRALPDLIQACQNHILADVANDDGYILKDTEFCILYKTLLDYRATYPTDPDYKWYQNGHEWITNESVREFWKKYLTWPCPEDDAVLTEMLTLSVGYAIDNILNSYQHTYEFMLDNTVKDFLEETK